MKRTTTKRDESRPTEQIPPFPRRYRPLRRLGGGGGGEVWEATDLICGEPVALKVLAADAGEAEVLALVREATTLSGLETAMGAERQGQASVVHHFGRLEDGRAYLVRDLVPGVSFAEYVENAHSLGTPEAARAAFAPLLDAANQLTLLHRAGLLHGDLKPGNLIVTSGEPARGHLVDFGLAVRVGDSGQPTDSAQPHGLTPYFAAPELMAGGELTVRAEVFSFGRTLAEALRAVRKHLDSSICASVELCIERATLLREEERYPSIDELAADLEGALQLWRRAPLGGKTHAAVALPVVGIDETSDRLRAIADGVPAGKTLTLKGPKGAGCSTLLRRLVGTLGVSFADVIHLREDRLALPATEALRLELDDLCLDGHPLRRLWIALDLPPEATTACTTLLAPYLAKGARLICVDHTESAPKEDSTPLDFVVPKLPPEVLLPFVKRAAPALSRAVCEALVDRCEGRPARLRDMLSALAGRPVVRVDDLEKLWRRADDGTGVTGLDDVYEQMSLGRFRDAEALVKGLLDRGEPSDELQIAAARIALARGAVEEARHWLHQGRADDALPKALCQERRLVKARVALRAGDFAGAEALAKGVDARWASPETAIDACIVHGLATALGGDLESGGALVDEAARRARESASPRLVAVAETARAIIAQRRGDGREARIHYQAAIDTATEANDAATLVSARLNLAALLQTEGDLAAAVVELESATALGEQAGVGAALVAATLHLSRLDLFLGRYARVRTVLENLEKQFAGDAPSAVKGQLLALRADLAAMSGEPVERIRALYTECAAFRRASGQRSDVAEAELEGLLARVRPLDGSSPNVDELYTEYLAVFGANSEDDAPLSRADVGEHRALAALVEGELALLKRDLPKAQRALEEAIAAARECARTEWLWRAHEAVGRLHSTNGNEPAAERERTAALALLEKTAARLPRDLREVYWNDPRRKAVRETARSASRDTDPTSPWRSVLGAMDGRRSLVGSLHNASNPTEARLAALLEILRELVAEHDLPRLLARVAEHAVALVGAERGFVVLRDGEGNLAPRAARNARGEETFRSFSRSVAERVVATGQPIVTTQAQDDLDGTRSIVAMKVQAIACVPIRSQGALVDEGDDSQQPLIGSEIRTIGALYLEIRATDGGPTPIDARRFQSELPTLQALADHAALAIENARLLEENKRRRLELEAANHELELAKAKLAESLDLRTEQLQAARRDLHKVRTELRSHFGWAGIVGTSEPMRKLYAVLERVKDADIPVLISGESGTGKEVVAKAIHAAGARSKGPFLGINCGAIPENLLESELFGHVRGAFTGADRDRKGLFREAAGGTVLLDEIGELPLKMQAGLLRVLQEKTVRPVGSAREESVDVRIVAATNRDLAQMVEEGTFREDLFYRIHVVPVSVPPLRERKEDIPALSDHFFGIFAARHRREKKPLSRDGLRALLAYDWPGNVRQLEHVLLNAWILGEEGEIGPSDLDLPKVERRLSKGPEARAGRTEEGPPRSVPVTQSPEEFRGQERERMLEALTTCGWNRVQAAKQLGMPRRTFYRRLKEYEIQ